MVRLFNNFCPRNGGVILIGAPAKICKNHEGNFRNMRHKIKMRYALHNDKRYSSSSWANCEAVASEASTMFGRMGIPLLFRGI